MSGRASSSELTAIVRAPASSDARWWRFEHPIRTLVARSAAEVPALLDEVETEARQGAWAVGFVAYEAAPGFEAALTVAGDESGGASLARFGLFARVEPIDLESPEDLAQPAPTLIPAMDFDRYAGVIATIREAIARGETYQVNFSFPLSGELAADPARLFAAIASGAEAPHAAFLAWEGKAIVSFSPELFFALDGDRIVMRPMKGTRPRGRFPAEDRALAEELAASEKERAENLMIVDMVRNDLGRIARVGAVEVERLYEIERYPTVWQMTSTVAARTEASLSSIFRALFPCASVTGAPKRAAMEIIASLEAEPRGIYCGAIGWIAPGVERRANFAVAIRTALCDRDRRSIRYPVGSGVVWDSQAEAEYAECLAKAAVALEPRRDFRLFETMRWTPQEGVALLDLHLERLAASAEFLGFRCDPPAIRAALAERGATLRPAPHRVRLEQLRDGAISLVARPFADDSGAEPWRVHLASRRVARSDRRLFHKTTERAIYDEPAAEALAAGADEALFLNEEGELTEGTRTNLVLEIGGERLTPSLDCGLLPGVFREHLLRTRQVRETVLREEDLARATRIFLVNALRGWIPAVYAGVEKPAHAAASEVPST